MIPRPGSMTNSSTSAGVIVAKSDLAAWFATREPLRSDFLSRTGWGGAEVILLREDMAARRYFRLRQAGQTAVLMESVPDGHPLQTAGCRLDDYIRIGALLGQGGIKTPHVLAQDFENGYLLLEDLGNFTFREAYLSGRQSRDEIYGAALAVLEKMRTLNIPEDFPLPDYYTGPLYIGSRRMMDWYVPAKRGEENEPGRVEEFGRLWNEIEEAARARFGPPRLGFCHADFHLENLMWRDGQAGAEACGVLDFQDARKGPLAYDLSNLLNDARMSLDPTYKRQLLDRFCEALPENERAGFKAWFWILSGQFLCRVAGQFVKHAIIGNTRYMQFMPFIQTNLKDILSEAHLAPIRDLLMHMRVDLEPFPEGVNYAAWKDLIAQDAY